MIDLMAALKRSVAEAKKRKEPAEPGQAARAPRRSEEVAKSEASSAR